MRARANPAMIGGFVVGAIALAISAILLIGGGGLFRDRVELVSFFPGSVNGLAVGAPVKFKGIEIGHVSKILFAVDEAYRTDFHIPVFFELDPEKMTRRGAVVTASDLSDKSILKELYQSGMRAQLASESFVTGVLYVELDIHPGTEYQLHLDDDSTLLEMPTLPTDIERVASAAKQILAKLEELDIKPLMESLGEIIDNIQMLVSSPELIKVAENLNQVLADAGGAAISVRQLATSARGDVEGLARSLDATLVRSQQTLTNLDRTIADASATFDATSTLLEPESPLVIELAETLHSLDEAARSVRRLADSVERNPSTLVFGRTEEGPR